MIDAFSAWTRMMAASLEMAQTGMRLSETLAAANDVVATRSRMIGSALQSPEKADSRELARMVPEKVDAFTRSGLAVFDAGNAMQRAWFREAVHFSAMALRGRAPTFSELAAAQSRSTGYIISVMESGSKLSGKALAPVHAKATANARRLRRQ